MILMVLVAVVLTGPPLMPTPIYTCRERKNTVLKGYPQERHVTIVPATDEHVPPARSWLSWVGGFVRLGGRGLGGDDNFGVVQRPGEFNGHLALRFGLSTAT